MSENKPCYHENTYVRHDVGYNADGDGEERQHLETCTHCGAYRIVCEILWSADSDIISGQQIKGNWQPMESGE